MARLRRSAAVSDRENEPGLKQGVSARAAAFIRPGGWDRLSAAGFPRAQRSSRRNRNFMSPRLPGGVTLWMIINLLISFGFTTVLFAMISKLLHDVELM
jgi:hypothetical protein